MILRLTALYMSYLNQLPDIICRVSFMLNVVMLNAIKLGVVAPQLSASIRLKAWTNFSLQDEPWAEFSTL
jgi:hypothetical protein